MAVLTHLSDVRQVHWKALMQHSSSTITVFACPYSIIWCVCANLKHLPIEESVVVFRDGKSEKLQRNHHAL